MSTSTAVADVDRRAVQLVVGRIGRPHGVRGELAVEVRTDDPDVRFADGAVLATDPPEHGPLTVADSRWHSGRLLVNFVGVADRTRAEALRGALLVVDIGDDERLADPDEFYDHQLVGLRAFTTRGEPIGMVVDVLHLPAQDLLAINRAQGAQVLVPFVKELVPSVDLDKKTIAVEPRPGLLDPESLDETSSRG